MHTAQDTKEFMLDRFRWPKWPHLPLKRHGPNGRLEVAVMIATDPLSVVYGANIYSITPEQIKTATAIDVDQLIKDGWGID